MTALPKGDLLTTSFLFYFLQYALFLVEAFKLAFGIVKTIMVCNICFWICFWICFEILRFLSYLLCVLRRQGPVPRIPQPPLAPTGSPGRNQGVRGYVTS